MYGSSASVRGDAWLKSTMREVSQHTDLRRLARFARGTVYRALRNLRNHALTLTTAGPDSGGQVILASLHASALTTSLEVAGFGERASGTVALPPARVTERPRTRGSAVSNPVHLRRPPRTPASEGHQVFRPLYAPAPSTAGKSDPRSSGEEVMNHAMSDAPPTTSAVTAQARRESCQ